MSADPMMPRAFRVRRRRRETRDTVTLELDPPDADADEPFAPGQFNMLYAFGVGEVPVSMSRDHRPGRPVTHTVRAVGAVSTAICRARAGDRIGVRGPFGVGWDLPGAEGADLVLVAGGIGLAPLRSALLHALGRRRQFGRITLLVGARSPEEILFRRELERLRARPGVSVEVTVDRPQPGWTGDVGVVTQLMSRAVFEPGSAVALVCGPEAMMRFAAAALEGRGVDAARIRVSLERNMKCAVGWCGHCQLGPTFVCRDGPVVTYDRARALLEVPER